MHQISNEQKGSIKQARLKYPRGSSDRAATACCVNRSTVSEYPASHCIDSNALSAAFIVADPIVSGSALSAMRAITSFHARVFRKGP